MEHIINKKFAIATVAVMVVMITGIITAPPVFASSEKQCEKNGSNKMKIMQKVHTVWIF